MLQAGLTSDQQAESDRIYAALQPAAQADLRALADLLATTPDAAVFGRTEFTVRDIVRRIGETALATALEGRKKGGTTGPAGPARGARGRPSSSGGRGSRC